MSNKLSYIWICLFVGTFCLLATGCRRISEPERTVQQFINCLEQENRATAWTLLTKQSQGYWEQAAQRVGLKNGQTLFTSGKIWQAQRLRRDYKSSVEIKKKQASIVYFDELSRPITLHLRKEKNKWKLQLKHSFLRSPKTRNQKNPSSVPVKRHLGHTKQKSLIPAKRRKSIPSSQKSR